MTGIGAGCSSAGPSGADASVRPIGEDAAPELDWRPPVDPGCGLAGCADATRSDVDAGSPDLAPDEIHLTPIDAPRGCPIPTGGPTVHPTGYAVAAVWSAAGSPHIVPRETVITRMTVTIEPCAEVLLDPGARLIVNGGGVLRAHGEPGRPVRFRRHDPAQPWQYLRATNDGRLDLAHARIEGGGAGGEAMVQARGTASTVDVLRVEEVALADAAGDGLRLDFGAQFAPGSRGLTITGAGAAPVRLVDAVAATRLPSGRYDGNALDAIALGASVPEDTTLPARGVAYLAPDGLVVGPLGSVPRTGPVLTIEPGVRVRFGKARRLALNVGAGAGALIAVGTPERPIVFASAEPSPAAGDWVGLVFHDGTDPRNRVEHAVIEDAGYRNNGIRVSCNIMGTFDDGAGVVFVRGPFEGRMANVTIARSAGHGFVRGWAGKDVDLVAPNRFIEVAWCKQTNLREPSGGCPSTPCPP